MAAEGRAAAAAAAASPAASSGGEYVPRGPQPLLEDWHIRASSRDLGAAVAGVEATPQGEEEEVSLPRRAAVVASWFVFIVVLIYSSGVTLFLATVLQQLGHLPTSRGALIALFPYGWWHLEPGPDGHVELIEQNWLLLALPWFFAGIAWEALMVNVVLPKAQRPLHGYRLNDTLSSISAGTLYVLMNKVVLLDWGKYLYSWIWTHWRLTDAFASLDDPLTWWVAFFLADFLYYVWHRVSHYSSWLWANHIVHHSTEEYNLSTALRQAFNEFLTPSVLVASTSLAFLVPPEMTIFQGQFGLLYQFWIHTQLIPPLPTLELMFNSPSLHRIHHTRNPHLLGKNYGSVLSIWDRIGGTFEQELPGPDREVLHYGIIPPLNSWNPFVANYIHFKHMLSTQWKWHGVLAPFVHWTPPGGRCPRLGSRLNPLEKFDAKPSSGLLGVYVVAQFLLATVGALAVMLVEPPASWGDVPRSAYFLGAFLLALAALVAVSWLESARGAGALRAALAAEGGRQLLIVALAVALAAVLATHGSSSWSRSSWLLPALITSAAVYAVLHAAVIGLLLAGTHPGSRDAPAGTGYCESATASQ